MNLSNHMVDLSLGQETEFLKHDLQYFLHAFSTNLLLRTTFCIGHKPPKMSPLKTMHGTGHKLKDLNMPTLLGMQPMRTPLSTELNRSSLLLPGITYPWTYPMSHAKKSLPAPPRPLPHTALCFQPPCFLPKLIRFNPSPHSLLYLPSLIPWQEDWGDL